MAESFTNAQLFGGAITALIPSRFADVSTIRQVPDNQEVYLDTDGFTSLTFDITERVTHLSTDKEALDYHFDDIVAEEDSKEILSVKEGVNLRNFSSTTPVLSLTAKVTPPANPNPRPLTPTYTTIFLTLIRLVDQSTDIVISLNFPNIPDSTETSNQGTAAIDVNGDNYSHISEIAEKIAMSVDIKDWNLFSGE